MTFYCNLTQEHLNCYREDEMDDVYMRHVAASLIRWLQYEVSTRDNDVSNLQMSYDGCQTAYEMLEADRNDLQREVDGLVEERDEIHTEYDCRMKDIVERDKRIQELEARISNMEHKARLDAEDIDNLSSKLDRLQAATGGIIE